MSFNLLSLYKPTGDQPQAIKNLVKNINKGARDQVLLGVTGSGKTFTAANVIFKINKPTLVISHNKTLAAQLYQEFKEFFPNNAVEYFVSYYDYYQPESYIPSTDTYIEKEADINKEIEKLRLRATSSLMSRKDVIVVASVSCIYNLGSPKEYAERSLEIKKGELDQNTLIRKIVDIYYERNDTVFNRGGFKLKGEILEIWPTYEEYPLRIEYFLDDIKAIYKFNPVTGENIINLEKYRLFPAKHYVTDESANKHVIKQIKKDLELRILELKNRGKVLEAYRLKQKTNNDIEMLTEIGYCNGIENYSKYFDGRKPGEAPSSLLNFFGADYLLIVDESHITLPQIRGMYNGDRARKKTLIEYGFRLPSALDNRPLKFEEFLEKKPQTIYMSATPSNWEIEKSKNITIEQLVRPTGIPDPKVTIFPAKGQVNNLIDKIKSVVKKRQRVLVTTLTKRMAEDLSQYLQDKEKILVAYVHSDIDTLERSNILDNLRKGTYDVLVGINLLREGLDLPEVSLVAILDADKEGFLRSETSLVQTMGRAARHVEGEVIMYADNITKSIKGALKEVGRRRAIQIKYNKKHNITPKSVSKPIRGKLIELETQKLNGQIKVDLDLKDYEYKTYAKDKQNKIIKSMEKLMKHYAEELEFEKAARVRDKVIELKKFNE